MPACLSRSAPPSRVAAALAIAVTLASTAARAQERAVAPNDAEAKAEARFRDGSQAFDAGRVEEACLAFDESLRIYPTLGTLLNLALCHEKEGKNATAWREFSHAAAWASQASASDRRDFAHQHAIHLERSLSRVVIANGSGIPSLAIEIDGAPVDSRSSLPFFLDPGQHPMTAGAPGFRNYESAVTVPALAAADAIMVRIPALEALAPSPRPATSAAPARPASRPIARTAGWVVGGAGIALVGTGIFFDIDALTKLGRLESPCGAECNFGAAKTAEAISLVTFTTGAAALATGAWLLFAKGQNPTKTSGRPQIVPDLLARGGGLRIMGRW